MSFISMYIVFTYQKILLHTLLLLVFKVVDSLQCILNRKLYKQQRKKFVSIRRKLIEHYFSNIASNGIITNKIFWKAIKPFLANKGCLENSDIMLITCQKMITHARKNQCNFLSIILLTMLNGPVALNPKKQNLMLDKAIKMES